MTDKNFVHNLSREYLQIMAFVSLGIIRMDNYVMGSVGTTRICFYFKLVRAKYNNTTISINTSPFVNAKITAVQMILIVKTLSTKIFDDS